MLKGKPLKVILLTMQEGEIEKQKNQTLYERYMFWVSKPFSKTLPPERFESNLKKYLSQAHLSMNLEANAYFQFVIGHILLCLLMILSLSFMLEGTIKLAVIALLIYISIFPMVWIKEKASIRMRKIKKEMPSIIMIMAITMEAGAGINQAIREITRVKNGEFVSELTLYLESLEMGYSRKDALTRMSERLALIEITQFTAMLEESLEKGAEGLSKSLKSLSESIWDKRVDHAKVLASKASAKLFLPLLLLVFPAMLIFILSPAVFSIMKHFGS